MRFGSNVSQAVQRMLNGCTDVDPQVHGMTTDEERAAAKLPQVGDRVKVWGGGQEARPAEMESAAAKLPQSERLGRGSGI